MPTPVNRGAFDSSVHGRDSHMPGCYIDFLWDCYTIAIDIRTGRVAHVSDQRSLDIFSGRSDKPGYGQGRQVSEQELLGRWETERHSDGLDNDLTKACTLEQATELLGVAQRECGGAGARCFGAEVGGLFGGAALGNMTHP